MRIVIIGGGPGGYVAAIKAAQLGAEVVLIEKEYIGGTCLNVGCIPTKALLNTTGLYRVLKNESEELGLKIENLEIDWESTLNRKELVVTQLVEGVKNILRSLNVNIIYGNARFVNKSSIEVDLKDGGIDRLTFDKAIVATGSKPMIIPVPGHKLEGVITSTEAMNLQSIPKSICIIGGGVIGVEFANIFSNLGCKVTIIEMLPDLVSNMDREMVYELEKTLIEKGVEIYKSTMVTEIEETGSELRVKAKKDDNVIVVSADKVLMATGRKPSGDGLGLEGLGARVEKGAIKVDNLFKTDIDNIYAIGDCTGGVQLAHYASASGKMVAEMILGHRNAIDFRTVPYCVYTDPELASVGLTEEECLSRGLDIRVGRFPMYGNGKAIIKGNIRGLVKIIASRETGEILGMHVAGESATELISTGGLAIRLEATSDEFTSVIYPHPTISESIGEAAEAIFGKAIHIP